ncbi:MAG: hypothetical protein EP319_15265 [Deltaproteobacteria bacterium]|nr:MAG: hypothetical protein EP319_15265 [Deltaproteobacteria bacterium]
MRLILLIILTMITNKSFSAENKYYGAESVEAILTFKSKTLITDTLTSSSEEIREQIDFQIQHLMGTFQAESFLEEFPFPGVLGETYKIKNIKKKQTAEGLLVSYSFEGKVAWSKKAFKSSATRNLPIKLPLDPNTIYELGLVGDFNPCTDEHYNTEGDFWYFWDPDKAECPLATNTKDVLRIKGQLKKLPSTRSTYPEYQYLYGDNGNGKNVDIHLYIGYIDEENLDLSKPDKDDHAFVAMEYVEEELESQGYKLTNKKDAFREYKTKVGKGINFLRLYEKEMKSSNGMAINVRVKILLSDTQVNSKDDTFHNHITKGLEEADILIYDGHSGLGGNLHLDNLPPVDFVQKKYQLFFFNGCSSYPYFNGMFFNAKGGSEFLDIVTSGLPTYSDTAGPNMTSFIDGFVRGKTWSYQTIMRELEQSNSHNGTYLTGVNGDEDNIFKP